MAQFLGFGNGSDGAVTLSGTDAPIDSSCSGTGAATSLSATNASFAAGQLILIIQMRGTGAGNWEVNQIASYSAGTITTRLPLANTYTDSGASQAQVLVLKQYSSVTVSGTLTAKAWDGNVGGIIAFVCSGKVTVTGTITATEKGFRNNALTGGQAQGEGTGGSPSYTTSANGNGAGGGGNATDSGHVEGGHGGGGGNITVGATPPNRNTGVGGTGGSITTSADFTTMTMGGAGGWGGNNWSGGGSAGAGGTGGGIVLIFARTIEVSGAIVANGGTGGSTSGGSSQYGAGGGGAGGCIFLKAINAIIGSSIVTALAGSGGTTTGSFGGTGGTGSVGGIRIESCTLDGSSNPSASTGTGGHAFCHVKHGVL